VPKTSSCWVAPKAYQAGRDHTGGPLFSTREQLGVHGFNLILATGGLLTGLPEVAWETLYMSFAPDPFDDGAAQQPKQVRLAQCKGGGKGTQTHPDAEAKGPGGFLLDSSTIRSLVAPRVEKAARLKEGETRDFKPRQVVFNGPVTTDDNAYYGGLMRSDNFRAPITLVVPDARLHVSATHNDSVQRFDIRWSGTISYPPNAQFSFDVPTVWSLPGISGLTGLSGPFPVVVSESIFCGMTMDGAMNPYVQHWETTALVSDERFTETGKRKSVHGWIELLLGTVM
jgi:hypothetical protein